MDRADLISKLQKLSRLTIAAGATEAEAAAAAAKIEALMREYNISQDELSIKREAQSCGFDEYKEFGFGHRDWMYCARTIAAIFDCKTYCKSDASDIFETTAVRFFGFPADAAAAVALLGICANAITNECDRYMDCAGRGTGRHGAYSFRLGMVNRLNERIRALRVMPTGSGLIALKRQLVTEEWAKQNLNLRSRGSIRSRGVNSDAFSAGKRAAEGVDIGGGKLSGASRMIGRS